MADPVRWQLLQSLAHSDRRVGELVVQTAKPQNLVSYHLGELRKAGLVSARRSSADGRDVYYRVDLGRCRELLRTAGIGIHPALELSFAPSAHQASGRRSRPTVLFLCTGNSARSQMAAGLVHHRTSGAIRARSAGSHPKPLNEHAVRAMAARGIDIAGNGPTHFDRFARTRFDRVITLCDKVREVCPEFPGRPVTSHWSIPDPAVASEESAFERTAEEIEERVDLLIAELKQPTERSRNVRG